MNRHMKIGIALITVDLAVLIALIVMYPIESLLTFFLILCYGFKEYIAQ